MPKGNPKAFPRGKRGRSPPFAWGFDRKAGQIEFNLARNMGSDEGAGHDFSKIGHNMAWFYDFMKKNMKISAENEQK